MTPLGRYAALLNDGYGTQDSLVRQSISILNLENNNLSDFPDDRFAENAHQSLFAGLVFSSDGRHLYASVGSISDPTGEKPGNLGNGVTVYSFAAGKVRPEKFLPIPLQAVATGKKIAAGLRKTSGPKAIPYPAGLALVHGATGDRLLVASNLSDNVVLLDVTTERVLQSIDLSTNQLVPSSYPISIVASRDGRRAPRESRPRRDHHEGSSELPTGVARVTRAARRPFDSRTSSPSLTETFAASLITPPSSFRTIAYPRLRMARGFNCETWRASESSRPRSLVRRRLIRCPAAASASSIRRRALANRKRRSSFRNRSSRF